MKPTPIHTVARRRERIAASIAAVETSGAAGAPCPASIARTTTSSVSPSAGGRVASSAPGSPAAPGPSGPGSAAADT